MWGSCSLVWMHGGGLVSNIEPGSLAEYINICPGDRVLSVNGHVLRDEIDFKFYGTEDNVTLEVLKSDSSMQTFQIEKEPDDLMGITFDTPIFDGIKTCVNNCSFCFISQLPQSMRRSLYLRDDDYRLSFLFGNFISLTNLSQEDWKRLDEQKLSPLRVSLHTSNPEARASLMGNPKASRGMDDLKRLRDIGICIHIQIVLLKGINDGEMLLSTLNDLDLLGESIVSVGVVPAVYTRHRQLLPSPRGDQKWAFDTLTMLEGYAREVYDRRGSHWVYGADEFYFLSGKDFPEYEFYDDFPQFENGIGLVADFRQGLNEAAANMHSNACDLGVLRMDKLIRGRELGENRLLAVTGTMAYPEISAAVKALGLEERISVLAVENGFFGDSVTCSGLLTGMDISSAILDWKSSHHECEVVLIPSYAVFEDRFLDDMTVKELSEVVNSVVRVVTPLPYSLLESVVNSERE